MFDVKLKKTGTRIPVVLAKPETERLFEKLDEPAKVPNGTHGRYGLAARLQYGAGLRLSELVRLRIKDVDLVRGTLTVRMGKGDKDRMTVLPKSLREQIAEQIEKAREIWRKDRDEGLAGVYLPGALARKYRRAAESFEWFWLFPARQTSVDPETRCYDRTGRDDDAGGDAAVTRVTVRTRTRSTASPHASWTLAMLLLHPISLVVWMIAIIFALSLR